LLSKVPPSPYVVKLLGVTRKPFCQLTEYVDGGSLSSFLKNSKSEIPLQTKMAFMIDICLGINHLHSNNIIHR